MTPPRPEADLRCQLRERLGLADPVPMAFERGEAVQADGFVRERIEYRGLEGDEIPAFLFTPTGRDLLGGVVVFHQHNGEFHFGKSEVAGLVGDPFQAFGPALARRGLVVLAPDATTFCSRSRAWNRRAWAWPGIPSAAARRCTTRRWTRAAASPASAAPRAASGCGRRRGTRRR